MSQLLKRILLRSLEEMPPWTSAELAHLQAAVYPEARLVLKVRDSLDVVPVPAEFAPFLPIIKRAFEDMALECERIDVAGDEARARVNAWAAQLRQAL